MAELTDHELRERVRERYSDAALRMADRDATAGCGCGCDTTADEGACCTTDASGAEVFGGTLYAATDADGAPDAAVAASLGCGVPTAVADLHEGEIVLDLGSGAGADVLISARRVGPSGRAIGLDMTDEMLELARANARAAGVENAQFVKGYLEEIPLPDGSVDVVISNCVINLAADKTQVLREAARVLRPGGRLAVSDVVADEGMDAATRADMEAFTGCVAGALTRGQYERALAAAGFADVEIRETHAVHEHARSAVVRARRPATCSLPPAALEDRVARWRRLADDALLDASAVEDGVRQRYRASEQVERELRELVAAEAACCPSLALDVRPEDGALVLDIRGPAATVALFTGP
jgi:arsenite methyltransferase